MEKEMKEKRFPLLAPALFTLYLLTNLSPFRLTAILFLSSPRLSLLGALPSFALSLLHFPQPFVPFIHSIALSSFPIFKGARKCWKGGLP